jgi:rare lipoprotein A
MNLTHLVTLVSLLGGFSGSGTPSHVAVPAAMETQQQVGFASYYGDGFHGSMTASGKLYDENQLTAAHRTLPFGTRLLITNLKNLRSVIVTITDRGPFRRDRIIDLSYRCAQQLHMLRSGVVQVSAEILP